MCLIYNCAVANYCLAAWEFYKGHQSEIQWDLVTLHPPLVNNDFYDQTFD